MTARGQKKRLGKGLDRSKHLRLGIWEAELVFPKSLSNKERSSGCILMEKFRCRTFLLYVATCAKAGLECFHLFEHA